LPREAFVLEGAIPTAPAIQLAALLVPLVDKLAAVVILEPSILAVAELAPVATKLSEVTPPTIFKAPEALSKVSDLVVLPRLNL
jgi:hypothetical protein